MELVGRADEIKILQKLYKSRKSEFIGVYGRRRVGKTYLIKQVFAQHFTFQHTALSKSKSRKQMVHFIDNVELLAENHGITIKPMDDWLSAFKQLASVLDKIPDKRKVVFIDEIPWMDAKNSDFLSAVEYFWNSWAAHRGDIVFIVCGSASTWIIDNLINNYGGLHNRITHSLKVEPFTLKEVKAFLEYKGGSHFTNYQILELYMILGGIPFYLEKIDVTKSVPLNIQEIFFKKNPLLANEYQNLFRSIFNTPEKYIAIVETLAQKSKGMGRSELLQLSKLPNGGSTTKILNNLENAGFIRKYFEIGKKEKNHIYQLIDNFTIFHHQFIKDNSNANWELMIDNLQYRTWCGYAFEILCLQHIDEIKKSLGITGIICNVGTWHNDKAQIDLIIDRRDQVMNLIEMKYSSNNVVIDKKFADSMQNKIAQFKEATKTKKAVHPILISSGEVQSAKVAHLIIQKFESDIFFS
jgi:uncharacterized protein